MGASISEPLTVPELERALEVSEVEDVRAWMDVIAQALEMEGDLRVSRCGLLLGGFALVSQDDRFYGGRIMVGVKL